MTELLQLYKKKDLPASPLTPDTILPGKTILEKLEKLYSVRQ